MDFQLIRVYYKAGVLIPFYLATAYGAVHLIPAFVAYDFDFNAFSHDENCYSIAKLSFLSGLIGFVSLSVFLNTIPRIGNSTLGNVITWFVIPYFFIACILFTQIDWYRLDVNKKVTIRSVPYFAVCFFHVIGLAIAYVDFRATLVLQKKEALNNQSSQDKISSSEYS